MAVNYGNLPCVDLDGVIHITVSDSRCACGHRWHYSASDKPGNVNNIIIGRDKNAVTCLECLALLECLTAPLSNVRS